MNLILVSLDSLNRHFLTAYGNEWVRTPNLTDFASRACVFDNHYVGSVPCMPARRELWTGSQEMWWRFWGPLEPWDRTLAHQARQANVTSMLVTDHYHFFEWGSHGYQNDFHGYEFIRGHESDNHRTEPLAEIPDWARVMVQRGRWNAMTYLRNVQGFSSEEDFFAPKTFRAACEWLDRHCSARGRQADPDWAGRPFYLHIDEFDPHEPFHVPEPYRSMYTDDDYRKYSPWPSYGRTDEGGSALSAEEIAWVRAQYAGKVSMCDTAFGRLLAVIDNHKLWDDTAIIVTTDHGHYLGDHGWMGKPRAPLYRTLVHIPLLIWHPGASCGGRRTAALTQPVDLYPTCLDILGAPVPRTATIHGRSLMPVLNGADRHRDFAFYGYCNALTGVTDGQWALTRAHDDKAAPAAVYTMEALSTRFGQSVRNSIDPRFAPREQSAARIPGVDHPVWRAVVEGLGGQGGPAGAADFLWDLSADPDQRSNVAAARSDQAARLAGGLREHLTAIGAPEEQFARLHL